MKIKAIGLLLLTVLSIGFLLFQTEWIQPSKHRPKAKVLSENKPNSSNEIERVEGLLRYAFKLPNYHSGHVNEKEADRKEGTKEAHEGKQKSGGRKEENEDSLQREDFEDEKNAESLWDELQDGSGLTDKKDDNRSERLHDENNTATTNNDTITSDTASGTDTNNTPVTKPWKSQSASMNSSDASPTKVLLLTYMRGGSTFFGELLNQNEDAIYWFEPFAGMYSSYFGKVWHPEDYFFTADGQIRELEEEEEQMIYNTLDGLLDCLPDQLPTGVLSSPFLKFGLMTSLSDYVRCVLAENNAFKEAVTQRNTSLKEVFSSPTIAKSTPGAPAENLCTRLLEKKCRWAVSTSPEKAWECMEHLKDARNDIQNIHQSSSTDTAPNPFLLRERCVEKSRLGYFRCQSFLEDTCRSTNVRAVKSIRLRMDTVLRYLSARPQVKVVWYVRDPRGILNSRLKVRFLTQASGKDPGREAELLCRRMEADIEAHDRIFGGSGEFSKFGESSRSTETETESPQHRQSPESSQSSQTSQSSPPPPRPSQSPPLPPILTVRYEDLVARPVRSAEAVYAFLGLPLPSHVRDWVLKTTAADHDAHGLFGMRRTNATATAYGWRRDFDSEQLEVLGKMCRKVLDRFGYE